MALGAVTFLPEGDVSALQELELSGITEPDENSHVPDIDIEDYMVTIGPASVSVGAIEMETAGPNFGALIRGLVRLFRGGSPGGPAAKRPDIPYAKPSRVFGGAGKGSGTGAQRFSDLRDPKSYRNSERAASKEAVEAAKKSNAAQNIIKNKTFQECLMVGAGAALGKATTKRDDVSPARRDGSNKWETGDVGGNIKITVDLKAQKKDNHPSPADDARILVMVADKNTDGGDDENPDVHLFTYHDNYNRNDRLFYGACGKVPIDNQITLLQTWNGCCKYFNGENCEPETGMFKQTDREDGQLDGKHNDAVSSYWCNWDPNCAGAPGG